MGGLQGHCLTRMHISLMEINLQMLHALQLGAAGASCQVSMRGEEDMGSHALPKAVFV